jgi:hypothetical protein
MCIARSSAMKTLASVCVPRNLWFTIPALWRTAAALTLPLIALPSV